MQGVKDTSTALICELCVIVELCEQCTVDAVFDTHGYRSAVVCTQLSSKGALLSQCVVASCCVNNVQSFNSQVLMNLLPL